MLQEFLFNKLHNKKHKVETPQVNLPMNLLFQKNTILNIYLNAKMNQKLNNSFWKKAQKRI